MLDETTEPQWPTTLRSRLHDGRLRGVDGSLWMYRAVPLAPVVDASSPADGLAAAQPVIGMLDELAEMTRSTVKRRSLAKGSYRQIHLLLVNVPTAFNPGPEHRLADQHRSEFADGQVYRRMLLIGVRLRDSIRGQGFKSTVSSIAETLVDGGVSLADFDDDTRRVGLAMDRCGLIPLTPADVRFADAWWNHGRYADTPFAFHADHLHVMTSSEALDAAEAEGMDQCAHWTAETVPGYHSITFAAVRDLDLEFIQPTDPRANWVSRLIESNALCISIRGTVEPGAITREELRRQRKRFVDDINERYKQGKMQKQEQDEMLGRLGDVEGYYATASPPTLAGASIVVGFDGQYRDVDSIMPTASVAKMAGMAYRQNGAMAETWLCSNVRANPNLHDLPAQSIACSGLPSLSTVGDKDGALLGFTERDRQPAYMSPIAASRSDSPPLVLVAGSTGAGKSVLMLRMAAQFAAAKTPVIVWDPKAESRFDAVAHSVGGQVYSLDSLLSADGVFDPIRFSHSLETGVEIAADMLMSINPWGSAREDMEVPLLRALRYGAEHGGTCIGQCLAIAKRDLADLPPTLVSAVEDVASASAQFRAICGVNPTGVSLSASDTLTLIKVGSANLNLPEPGTPPQNLQQKISMAIVRMVVFGSATALMGRDGVLCMDEAWIVLGSSRSEVERLGRLARSQRVLPILFTQRVTDALNAGIRGYISRGMILPLGDPDEARAACELFGLEPTTERMERITAKATVGGTSANSKAPNWQSMRALRDPDTNEVLRGTIGIYSDLDGAAVPIEIALPQEFLKIASTNPDDIDARAREEAALHQAAHQSLHHPRGVRERAASLFEEQPRVQDSETVQNVSATRLPNRAESGLGVAAPEFLVEPPLVEPALLSGPPGQQRSHTAVTAAAAPIAEGLLADIFD